MKMEINFSHIRDLKDIEPSKISETFVEFNRILKDVYQNNVIIPDWKIKPPVSFDYLLILYNLVTEKQQSSMYHTIRAEFQLNGAISNVIVSYCKKLFDFMFNFSLFLSLYS